MPIFRREPPLIGASNAGGVSKNAILDRWPYRLLRTLRQLSVIHTAAPDRGKLVTLIAERRRLLFAVDGRRSVYDEKAQRYAKDNSTTFNCTQ